MDKPFPAYKGDDPYVFVCYAHVDSSVVYSEINWIHQQGVNIWYDEGIAAGRNWRAEIGESVEGATHVLFYISKASIASEHCNREINYALDEGKEIIPVYLEEAELTTDLKIGYRQINLFGQIGFGSLSCPWRIVNFSIVSDSLPLLLSSSNTTLGRHVRRQVMM